MVYLRHLFLSGQLAPGLGDASGDVRGVEVARTLCSEGLREEEHGLGSGPL